MYSLSRVDENKRKILRNWVYSPNFLVQEAQGISPAFTSFLNGAENSSPRMLL
jgi:hypothetical protein